MAPDVNALILLLSLFTRLTLHCSLQLDTASFKKGKNSALSDRELVLELARVWSATPADITGSLDGGCNLVKQ